MNGILFHFLKAQRYFFTHVSIRYGIQSILDSLGVNKNEKNNCLRENNPYQVTQTNCDLKMKSLQRP